MTKSEKECGSLTSRMPPMLWQPSMVLEVAKSVFQRYDAHGTYDLSPCYYSEVFADLELIANDN